MKTSALLLSLLAAFALSGCDKLKYTESYERQFMSLCDSALKVKIPSDRAEVNEKRDSYCRCGYEALKKKYPTPLELEATSPDSVMALCLTNCGTELYALEKSLTPEESNQLMQNSDPIPAESLRDPNSPMRAYIKKAFMNELASGGLPMNLPETEAYFDCYLQFLMQNYPQDVKAISQDPEAEKKLVENCMSQIEALNAAAQRLQPQGANQ